jgi:hypothetical protein
MFARDTMGPRAQAAAVVDSLTIGVQFNQKLDPTLALDSTAVTVVLLPDSIPVGVRSLLTPARHDSVYKRPAIDSAKARADSAARQDSLARPKPDTAKAPMPPLRAPADSGAAIARLDSLLPKGKDTTRARPSRPALQDRLMVRLAQPIVPGGRYAIDVRGVRNPSGATADSRTGLTVPDRPKPKPDSLAADSVKAGADSLRQPGDSQPPAKDAPVPPIQRDSLPADPRKQAPPGR